MKNFKERICNYCGNYYILTGNAQKYCVYCKYDRVLAGQRFRDIKSRGFLHNRHPKGKASPFYKNGIGAYPLKAKSDGAVCELCGSKAHLVVHHIDHNRSNNVDSNLQVLCKKCHQIMHHAVSYYLLDADGNVLHTLKGTVSVMNFLNGLGHTPKTLRNIRGAIQRGYKSYGFYWKRGS